MTLICVLGTDLSARLQNVLIGAQVGALLLFAVVALWKVAAGDAPRGLDRPALSWLNPLEIESTQRARRRPADRRLHLLGLGERGQPHRGGRRTRRRAPGQGGGALDAHPARDLRLGRRSPSSPSPGSTRIGEFEDDDAIFSSLAGDVLGSPLDQLVVLAVLTSALASTQTTILPGSRTTLSMARARRDAGRARRASIRASSRPTSRPG